MAMASTLPDLPVELLLRINSYLPTNDLLKFRLTSDNIAAAAATTLAERLHRLYIHPSEPALRAVPHICGHPVFSPAITEVVLVGHVPRDEIEKHLRERRCEVDKLHSLSTFAPWPEYFPLSKFEKVNKGWKRELTMDVLARSMARLPNVRKISFVPKCGRPGYNQVTKAVVKALPMRHIGKPAALPTWRLHDLKALSEITGIFESGTCTTLSMSTTLPFATSDTFFPTASAAKLRKVTLLLDLDLDTTNIGFNTIWLRHLFSDLPSIEDITLNLQCNPKHYKDGRIEPYNSNALADIRLTSRTLPCLGQLKIQYQHDDRCPMAAVCATGWSDFLQRHARSLQEVSISNILLTDKFGTGNVVTVLRDTVQTLHSNHANVSFRIPRLLHHTNCSPRRCSRSCRTFSRLWWWHLGPEVITVEKFEALASEMGVPLSEDGQFWDFGMTPERKLTNEMNALRLATEQDAV